jgi:aminopeptidase YwaD
MTRLPGNGLLRRHGGRSLLGALVLLAALAGPACGGSNTAPAPAAPTATPAAHATAAASPTALPEITVVPSPTTSVEPDGDAAYDHVLALSVEIGSRPAGSEAETAAAAYISEQLQSYGYETEIQEFPFESEFGREASLRTTAPEETTVEASPLVQSAAGQAEGQLVFAGEGLSEDYPPEGISGRIALLRRGDVFFADKVANAEAAGASAVVIFNNEPGEFIGVLSETSAIPAATISQDEGERLLSLLEEGPVRVSLHVAGPQRGTSRNVIGRPSDEPCETVSGGHFDSVPAGPGANDNASGTAAVLELARVVAARDLPGVHCFVLFGAEELGLFGSRHFVDGLTPEEVDALRAMLNFDVVSAGEEWQVAGSPELVDLATALAVDAGIAAVQGDLAPGLSSDHTSFIEAGIPAVFFFRMGEHFFSDVMHTPQDTADIVLLSDLEDAVTMGLLLLESLGTG